MTDPAPIPDDDDPRRQRGRIDGRDSLVYEERGPDGRWRTLHFCSEQLSTAVPHHRLLVESEAEWRRTRPDWACTRRADIVAALGRVFGSGVAIDTCTLAGPDDPALRGWQVRQSRLAGLDEFHYCEEQPDRVHGTVTRRLKLDARREADGGWRIRHPGSRRWAATSEPWARTRRREIIERIRQDCPPPTFRHHDEDEDLA